MRWKQFPAEQDVTILKESVAGMKTDVVSRGQGIYTKTIHSWKAKHAETEISDICKRKYPGKSEDDRCLRERLWELSLR